MIKTVSIKIRPDNSELIPYVKKLIGYLEKLRVRILLPDYKIFVENGLSRYIVKQGEFLNLPDIVIVVGGDGTLLKTVHLFDGKDLPILGINKGMLGFLTEFLPEEASAYLEEIIKGNYLKTKRSILELTLRRNEKQKMKKSFLNDVVISRGAVSHLIYVHIEIDGRFLCSFSGDGLIIATPTGSTAYSLSAGGPIISPDIQNVYIINPICPHTLNIRPLIIPTCSIIKVNASSKFDNVLLTIDGQETSQIEGDDEMIFTGTDKYVHLITHPKRSFYDTLRQKFGWGKHLHD